jgi:hypothetical protein
MLALNEPPGDGVRQGVPQSLCQHHVVCRDCHIEAAGVAQNLYGRTQSQIQAHHSVTHQLPHGYTWRQLIPKHASTQIDD